MTDHDDRAKVAELVKEFEIGMLTTIDESGRLVSRPMARQHKEFDGNLWFLTERGTRKVHDLSLNPTAAMSFAGDGTWLTISGRLEVVDDRAVVKDLWDAGASAYLPQGPDDESVVALKLVGEHAEYIDNPLGRIATAFSFVSALVTGQPFEAAEEGTTDL